MKGLGRLSLVAGLTVVIIASLAGVSLAASVTPTHVEGSSNKTCSEFAGPGQTWSESKIDPPSNDTINTAAGTITVSSLTETSFDWTATFGVDAVYVKSGSLGSNLYTYDPPSESTGDTNLSTGTKQAISHISFCWDAAAPTESPSPSATVAPATQSPTVLGKKLAATGSTDPMLPVAGFALLVFGGVMMLIANRPIRVATTELDRARWLDDYQSGWMRY